MGSKAFLLLGLLFAIVLLISSDVAARDLAEDSTDAKKVDANDHEKVNNGVSDQGGYGGGQGGYGGGYGGGRGGYGRGRCYYGCCWRGYYGRCLRCCYAGEAVPAQLPQPQAKPHN